MVFKQTQPKKTGQHHQKCYAELYIDDAVLGCPLSFDKELSDRPFVNWVAVESELVAKGILSSVNK